MTPNVPRHMRAAQRTVRRAQELGSVVSLPSSDANLARCDDGERTKNFYGTSFEHRHEMPALGLGGEPGQTQEYDSRMNPAHTEDKLPEILVGGQKQCAALIRATEEIIIRTGWCRFRGVVNLMPSGTQAIHNLTIDAFVDKEIHAALSGIG